MIFLFCFVLSIYTARCTVSIPYLTFSTLQAFKRIYKQSTTTLLHLKKDGRTAKVKIRSNKVLAEKTISSRDLEYSKF